MDSIKKWFSIQQTPFFTFEPLMNILILLFLPILFCKTVLAQNLVNLGLVGQWNNDYGIFKAVKVLEGNDIQGSGEGGVKYAFCATSKGMVIFDIERQSVISYIPMDGCNEIDIERRDNRGALYVYVAGGEKGLYIINVDNLNMPYYETQCDTPGSAEGVVIEGDYVYVADGQNGLMIIDIGNKSSPKIVGACDTPGSAEGVVIEGDYVYVADGQNGLMIIDISNKSSPKIVGACDTPGSAEGVAVADFFAYVADGQKGLVVIDISDKSSPEIIGTCDTPDSPGGVSSGFAGSLAIMGGYAYLADGYNGLLIIDLSNKNQPEIVATFDTPGPAMGVAVVGEFAYVADDYGGLMIVDISGNNQPKIVGAFDTPGSAWSVAIEGNYAYVADGYNGLQIIDISNNNRPEIVGVFDTFGSAEGVAIEGDHAYIADGSNGLQIIDISIKNQPEIIGFCDTPGSAWSVAIEGDYAYVADGHNGLLIIDISDKSSPGIAGYCITPGSALGVAIAGDYAYVADIYCGLLIIDISNKNQPEIIGLFDTPGSAWSVVIAGEYAYVADGHNGLLIIYLSNKSSPEIVGSCDIPGSTVSLAIKGEYAYVADVSGLLIIDTSNRNHPEIVGICDTPGSAWNVAIAGDFAYVADGYSGLQIIRINNIVGTCHTFGITEGVAIVDDFAYVAQGFDGLMIIDISNKNGPKIVGTCDTPGFAWNVAIAGVYAYVADGYNGLQIIDINNKNSPKIAGACDTPGDAWGVAIADSYAYVADGYSGLQIIDINNKNSPKIAGACDTPGDTWGVAIGDSYAYVADGYSGLQIINISDKNSPMIIGACDTPGNAWGVAIGDSYAYVADGYSGLQIIDISDKNSPMIIGACDTPDFAINVAIGDSYAYVADGYSGLQIIDISDKNSPMIAGNYDTPGSALIVVILGDNAYIADGPSGLLKLNTDIGYSLKGNLILVAGGGIDYKNPYWHATQILANQVFNTFINQGYGIYEIYYLNPVSIQDIDNDGIPNQLVVDDPTPTSTELKEAIAEWAANQTANTGPLYIWLIGHGAEDRFQVMPNEVITAKGLKECIDMFQDGYTDDEGIYHPGTNRHVVVIIESSASGTFIDNLIDDSVTVVTSTGDGSSHIKPIFSDPDTVTVLYYPALPGQQPWTYESFTTGFINALGPNLDPNYIPDNNPDTVNAFLRDAFIAARNQLEEWTLSSITFTDQAPQMAPPGNNYTALNFSKDGTNPIDHLFIDQNSTHYLTIIGLDPNMEYIPFIPRDINFFSSNPDILNTNKAEDAEMTTDPNGMLWYGITPDIKITTDPNGIPWYSVSPRKNGLFILIGYADPEEDPALLLSAKLTIDVSIDDPNYFAGKGKMVVIMVGYRGSGDYLWENTNNIGNHAYKTLRSMGYAKGEIYYYNPYLLQDVDGEEGYDEIRGYPKPEVLDPYMPNSPFGKISQTGVTELLLFFADHGNQDEFYLNPKETLSAGHLINQITGISDQVDERIIFLYDACYSGSFLREIEKADPNETLADKLITITSTDPNHTAYYLSQGMVSFSYPFFDEWSLTHSLLDAFDYAKESLPLKGQIPCISDPNRIRSWERQRVFYVDESRPVIDGANVYRTQGELHIRARIYSLTGISHVRAIIENAQYARKSSYGKAITETLELRLFPDPNDPFSDPDTYGGEYKLITPDPCPNETNYILNIYATNKGRRPKTAYFKTAVGSTVQNKTMALIIASSPELFHPENRYEWERLEAQVMQAEAILKAIGLSEEDIIKISNKNDLTSIHPLIKDKTPFIYIIGQVKLEKNGYPYLCLTPHENLYPYEFIETLSQNSDQRLLILMDTPYARQFLSALTNYNWSEKWTCIASTNQKHLFFPIEEYDESSPKKTFPCFSNLFFSGLLSGATVAQAYHLAKDAVSIVGQSPELLPKRINYPQIISHDLDYYLGISSIPRGDYSLFIDCSAKVEERDGKPYYTLSLSPHPEAVINAWALLTSSPGYLDQNSMIMYLEPNYTQEEGGPSPFYGAYAPGDYEYYKACFIVEGHIMGRPDINRTELQEVSIAQPINDIAKDEFEPDDDPNLILFDTIHRIIANVSPTRHTFYCLDYIHDEGCTDIDWVYFYAKKGYIYEIHAQDLSEYDHFIQLGLYDSNIMPLCDPDNGHYLIANNYLTFICRESGYYLIESKLASSQSPKGAEYILSLIQLNIGIGGDEFEPDDDPNLILFDAVYKIIPQSTRRHTFYCPDSITGAECNDIDWVYFYATEGCFYGIYAQDISGYNSNIQLTLYDSDFVPLCDPNKGQCPEKGINGIYFDCQEKGNYLLEVKLISDYPQDGVEYILSSYILDPNLTIGDKADLTGRVKDPNGIGINGLKVRITSLDGSYKPPASVETVSILDDSGESPGGYFYIHDITITLSPLNLEVCAYHDTNIVLHIEPLPQLKTYRLNKLPDITLTGDAILLNLYFNIIKRLDLKVSDFPPQGDYDGDGIPNWDEILIYSTDPNKPTVPLSLSKGMNLFYFPSVVDIPKILTKSLISIKDFFYYDTHSQSWRSRGFRLRPNCFNAIHILEPGVLYLELKPENRKPVLSLKGFLDLSYSGFEYLNPVNLLAQDLFDPDYFDPNTYALTILDNPNLTNIQMISTKNPQNGKWESSYRFFGRPAGKDIRIKSNEVYIVTKGAGEIK